MWRRGGEGIQVELGSFTIITPGLISNQIRLRGGAVEQTECVCVCVYIKEVRGNFEGGGIVKWPSQNRPHFKLKGLLCVNHHQQSPPGGLTGIPAQDGEPLPGFSSPYCAPRQSSKGQRDMKRSSFRLRLILESLWKSLDGNKL